MHIVLRGAFLVLSSARHPILCAILPTPHPTTTAAARLQVYMLLLGVTALSLLTTPFIVLLAMHWVLPKDEGLRGGGGGLGAGGGGVSGGQLIPPASQTTATAVVATAAHVGVGLRASARSK